MALSHKTLFTLLTMLMSEISEECICSSWEVGLEYVLWDVLLGKPVWSRWRQITPDQKQMLRELSDELDGWAVLGSRDIEPRFAPLSEWQQMYTRETAH